MCFDHTYIYLNQLKYLFTLNKYLFPDAVRIIYFSNFFRQNRAKLLFYAATRFYGTLYCTVAALRSIRECDPRA